MAKKAIVLLAEGFEEVEAVTPVDYLRRAGVEVTTAAVGGKGTDAGGRGTDAGGDRVVRGARGIPVTADAVLGDLVRQGRAGAESWDAVILPGGMPGASNLAASGETGALLKAMAAAGRVVAAICASPAVVLAPLGLLAGRSFTCYPGMEKQVSGAKWSGDRVVIDGNLVTSRGAGTAGEFAAALIGRLLSPAEGKKVAAAVLLA